MFPMLNRSVGFPRSLARLERELSDLMGPIYSPENGDSLTTSFTPAVNVGETETGFEVTVELPGVKRDDFHVEMHENELWVSGTKSEERKEEGKTWHSVERSHGEFRRMIRLPATANRDAVEAEYKDGLLKISIPKLEESKPKRIEVKGE